MASLTILCLIVTDWLYTTELCLIVTDWLYTTELCLIITDLLYTSTFLQAIDESYFWKTTCEPRPFVSINRQQTCHSKTRTFADLVHEKYPILT